MDKFQAKTKFRADLHEAEVLYRDKCQRGQQTEADYDALLYERAKYHALKEAQRRVDAMVDNDDCFPQDINEYNDLLRDTKIAFYYTNGGYGIRKWNGIIGEFWVVNGLGEIEDFHPQYREKFKDLLGVAS